ncbi:MAG: glycosyltransferase family 4 protein [Acidobacteriota bacterium]|nr:glycosyltransferase family 4 protein [Acidobacteriota bacterium]
MRVCICATQVPFIRGGAEALVETLHHELLARGFVSTVVTIPFTWTPRMQILKSAMAWRLSSLGGPAGDPDLVIATRFPSYLIRHPNKVVWLVHQFRQIYDLLGTPYSDFDSSARDRRIVEQVRQMDCRAFSEARALHAISHNVADRASAYNGADADVLYPPPKLTGRFVAGEPGSYIFTAGRLDQLKRVDLLLEGLSRTRCDIECRIAGDGPQRAELEALAGTLGLSERVHFLGNVTDDELVALYRDCLAVYYAPYDEDFGYVTIEAFKSEKPVLTASDSGAVLEFVSDGVTGFVHAPDGKAFSTSIDRLAEDPQLAARLGAAGARAVAAIGWDSVIESLTSTAVKRASR